MYNNELSKWRTQLTPLGNQLAVAICGPNGSIIEIEQLENDYLSSLGTTEIVLRYDAGDYMSFDFTAAADYMYISSLTDGLLQYCFATDELLPIDATVKGSVRRSVTGDVYVAPVGEEYIIQITKNSPYVSDEIIVQERTLSTGLLAVQPHKVIEAARTRDDILAQRFINNKQYELKDHLGNVNSVVSDLKTGFIGFDGRASDFEVKLNSVSNYYPFGSLMPGRNANAVGYRYGFNGKEMDNEVSGTGNQYDYGFRIYNPRIAKFLSVDPMAHEREWLSPYNAFSLNPINRVDPTGALDDWYISNKEGATDEPVWLPNDADATNVYGEDGFINLGENLLPEAVNTPDGGSTGKSYDVPSYVINAKGEYGQKDSQHPDQKEQNPRVLEYHATTQNPETGKPYTSDEIAWCASFTNWNITQVGLPSNENKYNATATGYNKWNTQYTQLDKPAVGALAVINNSHVTFVIGMNGKNIHGFGGNQSNQVKVSTYFSPSSVKYYLPVGVTPNYNVPTMKYNFNKVKNESTR